MPRLDAHALRKQIATRRLAPVYLFVGEDVRLVESTVDAVEATIDEADRPFAVERVYATEPGGSPIDVAAAARVFPMLGDRRIVIVLRAERLLKPKRASKATDVPEIEEDAQAAVDMAPLEDYLADPAPFTTLIFVATEIDRTRRFTKRLVAEAQVVEFGGLASDGPAGWREARAAATAIVQEEMSRAGRTIDSPGLQLLIDRAGGDVSKLRGDIDRLLLYTEGQSKIGRSEVDEIASADIGVEDDWAVVNAIGDGQVARALRETARRLEHGDSPHMLVGQLRWWVSARLAQQRPDRVRAALEALLRTDLALKSSGGDDRVLIERLVVELTLRPGDLLRQP